MKNLSIKLHHLGGQLYKIFISINILCACERWPPLCSEKNRKTNMLTITQKIEILGKHSGV